MPVASLVQLADIEVDQGCSTAQGARGQAGPVLHAVGPQVLGAPQGCLGQAGAGEAGRPDAHRASCREALEDRGNVLPGPGAGDAITLPGDETEDLVGAGGR